MEINMKSAAMDVALFCRLNMNRKNMHPLRLSEMGVLLFLSLPCTGAVSPAAISSYFSISKPSAAAVLKALTENGYIDHRPSRSDGRSYTVFITDAGRHIVEDVCMEYTSAIEMVRKEMGDTDFSQMIALISRANQILKDNDK